MSPGLRRNRLSIMVALVLGGRHVADGVVQSPVVVPVDPLKRGEFKIVEPPRAAGLRAVLIDRDEAMSDPAVLRIGAITELPALLSKSG